jgi:hypothetical protein
MNLFKHIRTKEVGEITDKILFFQKKALSLKSGLIPLLCATIVGGKFNGDKAQSEGNGDRETP